MLKSSSVSLRYYALEKEPSKYSGIVYDARGEIDQAVFNQISPRQLGSDLKHIIKEIPEERHNGALEDYPGFRQLTPEEEQELSTALKG